MFFNFLNHYFKSGSENRIGLCIVPRFCVLGEYSFIDKAPVSEKWIEEIHFQDYVDLESKLSKVIKKRFLFNRVVSVSFSIPEIYSTYNFDPGEDLEKQNILPKEIDWDSIDYTVKHEAMPLFAAIRQSDMLFWKNFFNRLKLISGHIITTGCLWHEFFPQEKIINCGLPQGTLYYNSELNNKLIYVPLTSENSIKDDHSDKYENVVFNTDISDKYSGYSHSSLLPLEVIISSYKYPNFNINLDIYNATTALKTESLILRWMHIVSMVFGGFTIALIALFFALYLLSSLLGINRKNLTHGIVENIRKENLSIQSKIEGYRELLYQRSKVAKMMSELGKSVKDSLWISEFKIVKDKYYIITIIGHSLNETSISEFLSEIEKTEGITPVRLEYTEKISPVKVAKLTHWRRKIPLYRFKVKLKL